MDTTYTTQEGEQWDAIAKKVYGSELLADLLMKANPEYLDVFTFGYGTRLHTPELPARFNELPPWRR